jgi:hypothetical protein
MQQHQHNQLITIRILNLQRVNLEITEDIHEWVQLQQVVVP